MVSFTRDQLLDFASWDPVAVGFGRESAKAQHLMESIRSGFEEIPADVLVAADGGLSNYCGYILTPDGTMDKARRDWNHRDLSGTAVLLSLLGPYAAIGDVQFFLRRDAWGWNGMEPADVASSISGELATAAATVVQAHGYQILDRETVLQLLPVGVVPYEYCLSAEPWDKIFHVLFSDTD